VMSGLAGQPAPAPSETLQRLINEELVLQAIPPEQAATAEQVKAQIATLEQTWGVDETAVVAAMEKVGLTRAAFERVIGRLLAVQAGLEALQSQGYDTTCSTRNSRTRQCHTSQLLSRQSQRRTSQSLSRQSQRHSPPPCPLLQLRSPLPPRP